MYAHSLRIQGSTSPGKKRASDGQWFEGCFFSPQAGKTPQGEAHWGIGALGILETAVMSLQDLARAALTPHAHYANKLPFNLGAHRGFRPRSSTPSFGVEGSVSLW